MTILARLLNPQTGEIRQIEGDTALAACQARNGLIAWLDLDQPGSEDLAQLTPVFGIHHLTAEDMLHPEQRPKLEQYAGYLQLVFYEFMAIAPGNALPSGREFIMLLGADYVITLHRDESPLCDEVLKRWILHSDVRDEMATYLAYLLIDAAVDSYFPVVEAINDELDDLEDLVMASPSEAVLGRIFALKKRLLHFRRTVTPLRDVFLVLMRGPGSHFGQTTYLYFQDVLDHLLRIGDSIDLQRDVLQGSIDLYMSSLSNRTNETMRKLTVLSTVLMTAALIAGIYGMNFAVMPELVWPRGYFGALWLMGMTAWILVALFRWRHYIGRRGATTIVDTTLAISLVVCVLWGTWVWGGMLAAPVVSRAKYEQVTTGMSREKVEVLFGAAPDTVSGEEGTDGRQDILTWHNPTGSWVTITLMNGVVAKKGYERLK